MGSHMPYKAFMPVHTHPPYLGLFLQKGVQALASALPSNLATVLLSCSRNCRVCAESAPSHSPTTHCCGANDLEPQTEKPAITCCPSGTPSPVSDPPERWSRWWDGQVGIHKEQHTWHLATHLTPLSHPYTIPSLTAGDAPDGALPNACSNGPHAKPISTTQRHRRIPFEGGNHLSGGGEHRGAACLAHLPCTCRCMCLSPCGR